MKIWREFSIDVRWTPAILLGVLLAAFGTLLPKLGYYWDDWTIIYYAANDVPLTEFMYFPFRPLHAVLDGLIIPVMGLSPLGWQIVSLVLRWLVAWALWSLWRRVWPHQTEAVTWAAILFAVYPVFTQQSLAVIYRQHWTTYLLFLLSLLVMLSAQHEGRRGWWRHVLAVLLMAAHLFVTEYLVGLELLRPLVLWVTLAESEDDQRRRIWTAVKRWLPYAVLLAAFVVWRMFFLELEDDPNPIISADAGLLQMLLALAQIALRDLLHIWWASWTELLQPGLIDLGYRLGVFAWALAGLAAALGAALFYKLRFEAPVEQSSERTWLWQAGLVGVVTTIAGMLPTWVTGRAMIVGLYSDRLSLPALLGASLTIVVVVYWLVTRRWQRILILSLLVGLAVGGHVRRANEFRWDWVEQQRFYWQLSWRAPAIEPGTALVADGALSNFVSRYVASAALNTIYPQPQDAGQPALWYFEIFYTHLDKRLGAYLKGNPISDGIYNFTFTGSSQQALLLYTPDEVVGNCLWVLTPADTNNMEIPPVMRAMAGVVSLEWISPTPSSSEHPPAAILGSQPDLDWCYYYQHAALAQQFEDWAQVRDLYKAAQQANLAPNAGYEWLPFIHAFGHLGQWDLAASLTLQAYERSELAQPMLCAAWAELGAAAQEATPASEVLALLGCEGE